MKWMREILPESNRLNRTARCGRRILAVVSSSAHLLHKANDNRGRNSPLLLSPFSCPSRDTIWPLRPYNPSVVPLPSLSLSCFDP